MNAFGSTFVSTQCLSAVPHLKSSIPNTMINRATDCLGKCLPSHFFLTGCFNVCLSRTLAIDMHTGGNKAGEKMFDMGGGEQKEESLFFSLIIFLSTF